MKGISKKALLVSFMAVSLCRCSSGISGGDGSNLGGVNNPLWTLIVDYLFKVTLSPATRLIETLENRSGFQLRLLFTSNSPSGLTSVTGNLSYFYDNYDDSQLENCEFIRDDLHDATPPDMVTPLGITSVVNSGSEDESEWMYPSRIRHCSGVAAGQMLIASNIYVFESSGKVAVLRIAGAGFSTAGAGGSANGIGVVTTDEGTMSNGEGTPTNPPPVYNEAIESQISTLVNSFQFYAGDRLGGLMNSSTLNSNGDGSNTIIIQIPRR